MWSEDYEELVRTESEELSEDLFGCEYSELTTELQAVDPRQSHRSSVACKAGHCRGRLVEWLLTTTVWDLGTVLLVDDDEQIRDASHTYHRN